jgi:nucleotide-binding universal stress UspA family protein
MTRAVVCGVDGSPEARDALRVAASLANGLGNRLIVAHVAEHPGYATPDLLGAVHWSAEEPSVEEAGTVLLERVAVDEVLPTAEQRVLIGRPAEQLAELAAQERADVIVVGSRGRGAFKAAFLGSVSHDLVGLAPCPVVIVPPGVDGDDARE